MKIEDIILKYEFKKIYKEAYELNSDKIIFYVSIIDKYKYHNNSNQY